MQGIKEALRKDKPSGLEPSSRYYFRTRKREEDKDKEEH
jgi:hypothetical protein